MFSNRVSEDMCFVLRNLMDLEREIICFRTMTSLFCVPGSVKREVDKEEAWQIKSVHSASSPAHVFTFSIMTLGGTFEWIPDELHCYSVSLLHVKGYLPEPPVKASFPWSICIFQSPPPKSQASRHMVWPVTWDGCVTHFTKGRHYLRHSTACFSNVFPSRTETTKSKVWHRLSDVCHTLCKMTNSRAALST